MTLEGTVIKGVVVLSEGAQLPEGAQVRVELAAGECARSRVGKAEIQFLSALVQQLVELRGAPERDEYGALRASQHAFETACQLLIDSAIVSALEGRQIPYGCVATDSEGGVRIEWSCPTNSIRLIVPASAQKQPYVYHEAGPQYGTEAATAEALARRLRLIHE